MKETKDQETAVENIVINCQTELAREGVLNFLRNNEMNMERYIEGAKAQSGDPDPIDVWVKVEDDGSVTAETSCTNKGIVLVDEEGSLTSVDYSEVMVGEMYAVSVRGAMVIYRKEEGTDVKWGITGDLTVLLDKLVEINSDAEKVSIKDLKEEEENKAGVQLEIS